MVPWKNITLLISGGTALAISVGLGIFLPKKIILNKGEEESSEQSLEVSPEVELVAHPVIQPSVQVNEDVPAPEVKKAKQQDKTESKPTNSEQQREFSNKLAEAKNKESALTDNVDNYISEYTQLSNASNVISREKNKLKGCKKQNSPDFAVQEGDLNDFENNRNIAIEKHNLAEQIKKEIKSQLKTLQDRVEKSRQDSDFQDYSTKQEELQERYELIDKEKANEKLRKSLTNLRNKFKTADMKCSVKEMMSVNNSLRNLALDS